MLLYDGDCGFCTRSVAFIERRFSPRTSIQTWQSADLVALGVSEEQLIREVVFVLAGRSAGGAQALALTLATGNRAGRLVGGILWSRPVRPLADRVYRRVAANRHRLPGSAGLCAVEPAPDPGDRA